MSSSPSALEDTPHCEVLTETAGADKKFDSDNTEDTVHTAVAGSSQIKGVALSESPSIVPQQPHLHLLLHAQKLGSVSADIHTVSATGAPPPRFLFGGGDEEQFLAARRVVELCGGSVVWPVESSFDESCTHLVLWKMTRTEKYLCACAAGKVRLFSPSPIATPTTTTASPFPPTVKVSPLSDQQSRRPQIHVSPIVSP